MIKYIKMDNNRAISMHDRKYVSLKQTVRQVFQSSLKLKDDTNNKEPEVKLQKINKMLDECYTALSQDSQTSLSAQEIDFFENTKLKAEKIAQNLLREIETIKALKQSYMDDLQKQLNTYKKSVQNFSASKGKGFYDVAVVIKNQVKGSDNPNSVFKTVFKNLKSEGHDILVFDIKTDHQNQASERTILMPNSSFSAFCKEMNEPSSRFDSLPVASSFIVTPYYLLPSADNNPMDIARARNFVKEATANKSSFAVEGGFTSLGYLRSEILTGFSTGKKASENQSDLDKSMLFAFDQMGNYSNNMYHTNGIMKSPYQISNSTLETIRGAPVDEKTIVPMNVRTHLEYLDWKDELQYKSINEVSM